MVQGPGGGGGGAGPPSSSMVQGGGSWIQDPSLCVCRARTSCTCVVLWNHASKIERGTFSRHRNNSGLWAERAPSFGSTRRCESALRPDHRLSVYNARV
eukprot:4757887-Prymnesium_polylepis.1